MDKRGPDHSPFRNKWTSRWSRIALERHPSVHGWTSGGSRRQSVYSMVLGCLRGTDVGQTSVHAWTSGGPVNQTIIRVWTNRFLDGPRLPSRDRRQCTDGQAGTQRWSIYGQIGFLVAQSRLRGTDVSTRMDKRSPANQAPPSRDRRHYTDGQAEVPTTVQMWTNGVFVGHGLLSGGTDVNGWMDKRGPRQPIKHPICPHLDCRSITGAPACLSVH